MKKGRDWVGISRQNVRGSEKFYPEDVSFKLGLANELALPPVKSGKNIPAKGTA